MLRAAAGELNRFAPNGSFLASYQAAKAEAEAMDRALDEPGTGKALRAADGAEAGAATAPARRSSAAEDAEQGVHPLEPGGEPDLAPERGLTAAQLALLEADEEEEQRLPQTLAPPQTLSHEAAGGASVDAAATAARPEPTGAPLTCPPFIFVSSTWRLEQCTSLINAFNA